MKKYDIVGLGCVVMDWVNTVHHLPAEDEKVDVIKSEYYPGGVMANYVTGVARLGAKAGFIGAVGNDEFGELLLRDLINEGVDVSQVVIQDSPTPVNVIAVDGEGCKIILQSPLMQTVKPSIDDINEDYISQFKLLHVSCVHYDTCDVAVRYAKKHGVLVSFDLEKQVIDSVSREKLESILSCTDFLLPNKLGALEFTGENDYESAAVKLLEYGPKAVIITLGEQGCLLASKSGLSGSATRIPAFPVNPVDTTGAGDMFNAAWDYGFLNGWSLSTIALFANAAAARSTLFEGARTGMGSFRDVINFIKKRYGLN